MIVQRVAVACLATFVFSASLSADVLFNEFAPNPPGVDPATQLIELTGVAGSDFTGFILEVDTDFAPGNTVDRIESFSGTFDSNGLLTVEIDDLENPSFSLLITDTFSGELGDVLDSADDLATLGIGTVFDAVNTADAAGDTANSIVSVLGVGTDLGFTVDEPELVFRDSITGEFIQLDAGDVFAADGTLLGSQADFGFSELGTFGAINPSVVPEPSAIAVLALTGLAAIRRRR